MNMEEDCTRKVKIFLQLELKNKILTAKNFRKRGWNCTSLCVLCEEHEETSTHLFLSCLCLRQLWNNILSKLNIVDLPTNLCALWTSWRARSINKEIRYAWDLYLAALWWTIWLERNRRIFQKKRKQPTVLINDIRMLFVQWSRMATGRKKESMDTFISTIL
jgi:hypothetical protein